MSIEELIRGVRAKYPHSRLEAATAQPLESLAEVFGETPPEDPAPLRHPRHGASARPTPPPSRREAATAQPLESLAEVFGKTPPEYPSLLRQLGHGVIGR